MMNNENYIRSSMGHKTAKEIAEDLQITEAEVISISTRIIVRQTMYSSTRKYKYARLDKDITKPDHDNSPDDHLNPILS